MLSLAVTYVPSTSGIRICCFSCMCVEDRRVFILIFFLILKAISNLNNHIWERLVIVLHIKTVVFYCVTNGKCWTGKSPYSTLWSLSFSHFKLRNIHHFARWGPLCTSRRKPALKSVGPVMDDGTVSSSFQFSSVRKKKKQNHFLTPIRWLFQHTDFRGIQSSRKDLKDTPGKVIL